jgi:serine/threonine-protein kinase
MTHPLTEVTAIDVPVEQYLRESGEVFQAFRHQDSGTTSYGVLVEGERWFVKPSDHPSIVESLRRALHLNTTVRHPALPRFRHTFETPGGLELVYDWVQGEVLAGDPRSMREQRYSDPANLHMRFRSLPVSRILAALDTIFDVHVLLADHGFVASDFYDGCIIYDFEGEQTFLCDLDEYRHGPFVLERDRAYGSTRYMAPEEWRRGATIDQVTNVFNLGRAATVLLGDGTASLDNFKGADAIREVVERATDEDRTRRHQSVGEFVQEWRAAAES